MVLAGMDSLNASYSFTLVLRFYALYATPGLRPGYARELVTELYKEGRVRPRLRLCLRHRRRLDSAINILLDYALLALFRETLLTPALTCFKGKLRQ